MDVDQFTHGAGYLREAVDVGDVGVGDYAEEDFGGEVGRGVEWVRGGFEGVCCGCGWFGGFGGRDGEFEGRHLFVNGLSNGCVCLYM